MNDDSNSIDQWVQVDEIVEEQLALQVEILFNTHMKFMSQNGLEGCKTVADLGTGSGSFICKLAEEFGHIRFTGIDKREHLLARAKDRAPKNVSWVESDIEKREIAPHIANVDGLLMRYFLLHFENSRQLLSDILKQTHANTHVWIIDVDLNGFICEPKNRGFDLLMQLVQEFCSKFSVDTLAGQKIGTTLADLGFSQISKLESPVNRSTASPSDFARFLSNEAKLYSHLMPDEKTAGRLPEILSFIESEVATGKANVSYGMIMWHATT